MRLDAACSGLCKRRPYHRHPFSLFHQLALLTSAPAHVAGGERRPILRLRHCLPSWFTVHSQAMLHFPQSPRHGQRAQQPMPRAWRVAFAGDKALRIFQQLALRVRDAKR
jgi:hypothetical protein